MSNVIIDFESIRTLRDGDTHSRVFMLRFHNVLLEKALLLTEREWQTLLDVYSYKDKPPTMTLLANNLNIARRNVIRRIQKLRGKGYVTSSGRVKPLPGISAVISYLLEPGDTHALKAILYRKAPYSRQEKEQAIDQIRSIINSGVISSPT